MYCGGNAVSTEMLVPDFSMSSCEAKKIAYSELVEEKVLGEGTYNGNKK